MKHIFDVGSDAWAWIATFLDAHDRVCLGLTCKWLCYDVVRSCAAWRDLVFSSGKYVTSEALNALCTYLQSVPNLRLNHINLCDVFRLCNDDLMVLTPIVSRVRHLLLRNCSSLRGQSIELPPLLAQMTSSLVRLDVSLNRGLRVQFTSFPSTLTCLSLRCCGLIMDDAVAGAVSAQRLPVLTEVDLGFCGNLGDATISALYTSGCQLTKLSVKCTSVTTSALTVIAEWSQLQTLDISGCLLLRFHQMYELVTLTSLTTLDVGGLFLDDVALYNIAHPFITSLNLLHSRITNDGINACLRKCTMLRTIEVTGCDEISDRGLLSIGTTFTHLRSFSLSNSNKLTDAGLQWLCCAKALREVDVSLCIHLTDDGLKCLTGLLLLQKLNLFQLNIGDNGMCHVGQCSSLMRLDLGGCNVTDDGIACLSNLSHLTYLSLAGCSTLTGAALKHLTHMPLAWLNLGWIASICDEDMMHLQSFADTLRGLLVNQCWYVGDAGVAHLQHLKHLNTLNLADCAQVTDESVRLLESHPLKQLDVSSTHVTSASIHSLLRMPLEDLSVVDCAFPSECVRVLVENIREVAYG